MVTHQFTVLFREKEITDEDISRLYQAGCNDGLVGVQSDHVYIDFDREATSLIDAVRTALEDIQKSGASLALHSVIGALGK